MKFLKYLTLLSLLLWATPALAHRSPAGCSGSGLGINLYASSPQVHVGDVINFSVDVFNGTGVGPVVCDATAIQAFLVTPDGQSHTITLVRTALSNGQIDLYPSVVSYTARMQDVKADGTLTATANDVGTIHQNNTDSLGGGNQGVNVTVTAAVIPPVVETPPTGCTANCGGGGGTLPLIHITKVPSPLALTAGPGPVLYTYAVTNPGIVAMSGVWVKDDKCAPVIFLTGDTDNNLLLNVGETWIYSCAKTVSQTETNIVTTHGQAGGWEAYDTAEATVVVSRPAPAPFAYLSASAFLAFTPSFPDTGLAPEMSEW